MSFRSVDPKQNFPQLEERILKFWQQQRIFEKTSQAGLNDQRPVFIFYEGPPTANGLPGIHHVLTRAFKDVIPRYKTMAGFRVPRKAGWDCHGLPVEVEVEKSLSLKGKPQIEQYGVAEFNARCKESVLRYINNWDRLTQRIGYWLDTDHAYRTLDNDYIESCWSLLKYLWNHQLLKQDYKITKHCPRCETSLAEAEANQGMKENVEDPAITVKLVLRPHSSRLIGSYALDEVKTSLLIWTTTPWTLPANVAAALHPKATYALCEVHELDKPIERVILLKEQIEKVLGKMPTKVLETCTGQQLAGLAYVPIYEAQTYAPSNPLASTKDAPKIYVAIADESVDPHEGTGIVHIAPAYGDLEVGRKHHLAMLVPVGLNGKFTHSLGFLKEDDLFFKNADPRIIRDLKDRGLLFKNERIHHSYPFCWRCDTPLLYLAKASFYIQTTAKKAELLATNEQINWIPSHIKEGRFGDWLRNNVDWAISRQRYWGTPLPLWECTDCESKEFVGSVAELSQRVGRNVAEDPNFDLHRPFVDHLTWPCQKPGCSGKLRRLPDVVDCWFDSGAMPYAQDHYLFDAQEKLQERVPADFICEAVDQTRGWFYTLHALSVLTSGKPAYKNCIVLGHILDEQGRKMSKRLGNIVDPWSVLDAEGADALRYYLYTASPPGQPRRFSQNLVRQGLRQFLLTVWNCYSFFATYAEVEYGKLGKDKITWAKRPMIDQWILGQLHRSIVKTTEYLESYDITMAVRGLADFVDELSNWYVRRNRDRFWYSLEGPKGEIGGELELSKRAAYHTLHECLRTVAQLLAPFLPFISEEIWQNLVRSTDETAAESVHLSSWPQGDAELIQKTATLAQDMDIVLKVVNLGRAARVESGIKIRQPLQAVKIQATQLSNTQSLQRFEREIKEELNVEELEWVKSDLPLVEYTIRPHLPKLGKKYGPALKEIQHALQSISQQTSYNFAQTILQEKPIQLEVAGRPIELAPDEILLQAQSIPGFAAQAKDGLVVALSTEITPALKERGIARELVRAIGELRKQAECKVSDRIWVGIASTSDDMMAMIANQTAFVETETLSTVTYGILPESSVQSEIEIEGVSISLTLHK